MTEREVLVVEGEDSSALLCRIIGLLAQLDLPAPQMTVTLHNDCMTLEMHLVPFGDQPIAILARKVDRLIGTHYVCLNGTTI
jgi:hypothetical protein